MTNNQRRWREKTSSRCPCKGNGEAAGWAVSRAIKLSVSAAFRGFTSSTRVPGAPSHQIRLHRVNIEII